MAVVVAGVSPAQSFLLRVAGSAIARAILDQFSFVSDLPEADLPVRRLSVLWHPNTSSTPADVAVCSCTYINITGGGVDDTWDAADFTAVEDKWKEWMSGIGGQFSASTTLLGFRWHHPSFSFSGGKTSVHLNDAVRIVDLATALAGAGGAVIPSQIATSVTLKTPSRKHWGRFYLPQLAYTQYTSAGQIASLAVDAIGAKALSIFEVPAQARGILPVVISPALKSVLFVSGVQVDSVPDVIRRRRPAGTSHYYRAIPDYTP